MDERIDGESVSPRVEANRRNAMKSTGPRTIAGKSRSRRNAFKHGILSSALLIREGAGAEDSAEFDDLLRSLHRDRVPVGALEVVLVEEIAVCIWRLKRSLRCEAGLVRLAFFPTPGTNTRNFSIDDLGFKPIKPSPELAAIKDHLYLPRGAELEGILRYEASIHRQLSHAINQLERLQRARRGEHVPAPISIELSKEPTTPVGSRDTT